MKLPRRSIPILNVNCNLDPYFHPIVTSWVSENSFDVKKRAVAAATYNVSKPAETPLSPVPTNPFPT